MKNQFLAAVLLALLLTACSKTVIGPESYVKTHLALGNPTNAATETSQPNNYLLAKPQYCLSYNKSKGHANWVGWELTQDWFGASDRQNDFRPDDDLPDGWDKITTSTYTGSGFDRGHLCPSADRTSNTEDNSATFLMTNIAPQAPELNREAWKFLEDFTRDVVKTGYKAYVVAGVYGTGGEGSNGNLSEIKNLVNVPARFYKVVVFMPDGKAVNEDALVIAADFPNTIKGTQSVSWLRFLTTPSAIEKSASIKLFANLPSSVQSKLKAQRFDYANSPIEIDAPCRLYNDKPLYLGKRGGCYYVNDNGNKTYVDRDLCGCE